MGFRPIRNEAGFSLVELMMVVAIIGTLTAISIPNFQKFQGKARQKEAQLSLAAVYGAEISNRAEFSTFTSCLEQAGFRPEGDRRYYTVGFNAAEAASVTCMDRSGALIACNDSVTIAVTSASGTLCSGGGGAPAAAADQVFAAPLNSIYHQTTATTRIGTATLLTIGGSQLPGIAGDLAIDRFAAAAIGNVANNALIDTWTINENKILINTVLGIL